MIFVKNMKSINQLFANYTERIVDTLIDRSMPLTAVAILKKATKMLPNEKKLYFALGRAYYESRKLNESINILVDAVNKFPDALNVRSSLARWLLKINRPADALEHFEICVSRLKDNDQNNILLGNIYALMGHCYLLLKQWINADESFEKSVTASSYDLDYCIGKAGLYTVTGRLAEALDFLTKFVDLDAAIYPPYAWTAYYLQYYFRDPEESILWYQKALEKIANPETRLYCGWYHSCGDMFDTVLRGYVEALIACGRTDIIFSEVEKYEKYALDSSRYAEKRQIDFYIKLGNFAEAEKKIKRLPNALRNSPDLLCSAATLEFSKGDLDGAQRTIDSYLRNYNESHDILDVLGEIQIRKKMWEDALITYQTLNNASPLTTEWLKNIALCYSMMGDHKSANTTYKEVVQYDNLDADAWIELADTYLKLGLNSLAIPAFQKGLEYDWLDENKRQHALNMLEQMKSK